MLFLFVVTRSYRNSNSALSSSNTNYTSWSFIRPSVNAASGRDIFSTLWEFRVYWDTPSDLRFYPLSCHLQSYFHLTHYGQVAATQVLKTS